MVVVGRKLVLMIVAGIIGIHCGLMVWSYQSVIYLNAKKCVYDVYDLLNSKSCEIMIILEYRRRRYNFYDNNK